jgi:hypothetical protein
MSAGGSQQPATLLVHDGELADVRALLASLKLPCTERRAGLPAGDLELTWGLVVTTPQRASLLRFSGRQRPTCIAVCDRDSRTLRNALRRAGIALMVRRPVHPAALRALVLHALYRGPERRRNTRIPIGAPVSLRRFLRRRTAVLADLSIGGCKLLTDRPIDPGSRFALLLPPDVAAGRALGLRARVLRSFSEGNDGEHVLTAQFERLGARRRQQLERTLEAFAEGPAVLAREVEISGPPAAAAPPAPPALPTRVETDAVVCRTASQPTAVQAAPPLVDQAARVLLGRDISISGMRVDRDAQLRLGQDVRLALHVTNLAAPLVVTARVHRDEGGRGVVLRFHALSPEDTRHLAALVDSRPAAEPGAGTDDAGLVVSELLEALPAVA